MSDFKSLNGTWSGVSISDTRKIPTTWSDTTLRFEFDSDCDEGNISGHGVSLWRGLTIEFDIQGKFRNSDQSVQIVKQHKGRFKNKITYRGTWKRKVSSDRFVIFGRYDECHPLTQHSRQKKNKIIQMLTQLRWWKIPFGTGETDTS